MPRALNGRRLGQPRGAAALVVVLVLFFVISLVAAYTSRGMLFEQRTSINQFRSTQALEIADAGLEWALTKLNAGLIGADCETDPAGASTFRDRYLTFAPADGKITAVAGAAATCIRTAAGVWNCTCPAAGATMPGGSGPGFRVHFVLDKGGPARANLIRANVSACTQATNGCLSNPQVPEVGQGNAVVSASFGLKGGVDTAPSAALTIPSSSTGIPALALAAGTTVRAYNTAVASGVAVQSGGLLPPVGLDAIGPPGTPASFLVIPSDMSLAADPVTGGMRNSTDAGACPPGDTHLGCSPNRVFVGVFGIPREVFREQPAIVRCDGVCDAATLSDLAAKNPKSVLRVVGDATIDGPLGSATDPVSVVVEGDVTFSGGTLTGLLYSTGKVVGGVPARVWTASPGTSVVVGAAVSEGELSVAGGGVLELRYDPTVLSLLRSRYGSFVRVPGSWRDFVLP